MRSNFCLLLALVMATLASEAARADCERGTYYVGTETLNVRSNPIDGAIVGRVHKGAQIEILECRGVWARIASSRWLHAGFLASSPPDSPAKLSVSGKAGKFRQLRDEGIRLLGWVAGNSYGHPIWPQVEPYVGQGGQYYDFFLRLAPRGLNNSEQQAEAYQNVDLYRQWFKKGQTRPFDEPDNMNKLKRILQLAEETVGVYR